MNDLITKDFKKDLKKIWKRFDDFLSADPLGGETSVLKTQSFNGF